MAFSLIRSGKQCCAFPEIAVPSPDASYSSAISAGCSTAELTVDLIKKSKKRVQQVEIEKAIEDGSITANPIYKIGNPYQVGGVWYYPERDLAYDETGIGSWYGDEFAGS